MVYFQRETVERDTIQLPCTTSLHFNQELSAMVEKSLAKGPARNRERTEWIVAVEQLVGDVEAWVTKRNWWVHRELKTVTEDELGSYEVPVLTMQSPTARFVLEPIARYVMGAEGRVDLSIFPSYDRFMIVRADGGWRLRSLDRRDRNFAWSERAFFKVIAELMATP